MLAQWMSRDLAMYISCRTAGVVMAVVEAVVEACELVYY